MKQKKENSMALLLHWAGEQKFWLFLAILLSMCSGLCIIVPYIGIYRLMDATFNNACTKELVVQTVAMIAAAVTLRFVLFGCSGVAAHKGAYGALFKVRCMVAEHMARAPLGALNERRTGDIKTVLNEDIEKLELFLAHNLPDLVCYLVGPVVIFIYLMTVNVPLALISLIPLVLAVVVMGIMFRNTDDLMERANQSITALNSVMIEYISGMKLIKAYNMGSKSFRKLSDAIQEENAMWNETSRRMGPPYAAFVVIIECGMLLMVPIGGMFFLKGSLTASALLLFVYVGSMYLTEIRPLQELGTNFANVLNAITKTKEILDIPIYEGGTDFPQKHDIELRNVRFSYDGKTDVLHGVNLKIHDGERMALVGRSGAGKSTVIELISRFYDVQEGEVLIGGKNVEELDYDTILKNIAIVFQKTFLTRDSVLENIRMGSNATLEEVRAAAKEAQIDDFIMSLPDGYDTKVGSFGSRFSGGEKQRIAIARAILKNAPILILDEATSASDPENQMEIDKAIQNLCKGKTDDLMERANQSITALNSVMIEYISGMKLIKAYNMGSKSFRKLSDAIQEENAMWNETSRRMGPPYAAFVVIIECGMLLMVPIGGMFFLKGSLTASALLLFVYVGSMYLTEIRPLQELGTNFANVLNAITKTKEILDIPIYEGGTDFPQKHDIELRNVRFSYDGKTDVLHGVNLKIHDGERMALVGRSGAGKSTVIELISRFYDVQEGEVLIGGKNVEELDYDTILKNIAIVFQKTFLTRDSVLENIRMGSNATLEEVRAAAKEAQIDDFIMSLPDGYDTKVGSFGSRFSGGEKQRIAIARAILKNAPILILDEATSASDPENQMEIDKAIQNLCKGKTVIVVAHRLSALKMCNRVAVVENHTITSVGTHEEVRKNNAYYRKAWDDYETARNITYQLEGGEQHE